MRGGVVPVDAAAENRDGQASCVEGPAVRVAVDAPGETADDDEPCSGELAAEHSRDVSAVRRARASADDRDGGPVEQLQLSPAANEQAGRRVEDRHQAAREARRRARQPSEPTLVQAGQIRALVELALEPCEPLAPRS